MTAVAVEPRLDTQSHAAGGTPARVERTFTSWDGAELFYRAWLPAKPTSRALILLHRGHEHSARLAEVAEQLGGEDAAVFAWDQRGHGHSPGPRGGAESVAALAKDLDALARHLCREHGVRLDQTV